MSTPQQITKQAPAAAFAFAAAAPEVGTPREVEGVTRAPVKLTASSGVPFDHPWWGRLIFDFAGMRTTKDRLTLDYCHRADEVIGYGVADATGGNLSIAGELVSTHEDDRAREVMLKGAAGVPYEASVKFDAFNNLVVEEFQAGTIAMVNGQQIPGPLTVIRQCLVRGVAVCPYGADPHSRSEFSAEESRRFELTISTFSATENPMPAEENNTPPAKTAAELKAELQAGHQDYAARFGAELAAKWGPLGEGRPLPDCYPEFVASLRESHAAELTARDTTHAAAIADLQAKLDAATAAAAAAEQRLASLSLGEAQPVSGTAEGGVAKAPPAPSGMTSGQSRYVAEMRARSKK